MNDPTVPLSRSQLFAMVWSKPATHIASELNVPIAAVLKACDRLEVPRPTTGHWTKFEHGKAPPQPSLPPLQSGAPDTITWSELFGRRAGRQKVTKTEAALPTPQTENSVRWHEAVRKTRSAYRGGSKNYRNDTLSPKIGYAYLALSVTRDSLDRALLALNSLAWLLERDGFTFEIPQKGSTRIRLVFQSTGTEVEFCLREEVERYERELTSDEKDRMYIFNRWRYRPTGRLKLTVTDYYPEKVRKSWGDGQHAKLEDKLDDAAEGFVLCARGKHVHELAWQEQQQRWANEEKRQQEMDKKKRLEEERRTNLLAAARNWAEAEQLRGFRRACAAHLLGLNADPNLSAEQVGWLAWVDRVIQETDPLSVGFLKRLEQSRQPGASLSP